MTLTQLANRIWELEALVIELRREANEAMGMEAELRCHAAQLELGACLRSYFTICEANRGSARARMMIAAENAS